MSTRGSLSFWYWHYWRYVKRCNQTFQWLSVVVGHNVLACVSWVFFFQLTSMPLWKRCENSGSLFATFVLLIRCNQITELPLLMPCPQLKPESVSQEDKKVSRTGLLQSFNLRLTSRWSNRVLMDFLWEAEDLRSWSLCNDNFFSCLINFLVWIVATC